MSRFIDENRERLGVEPACRELEVSASAYRTTAALRLAVQRCTSSGTSVMNATSFSALIMNAYQGWLQESGEQDTITLSASA